MNKWIAEEQKYVDRIKKHLQDDTFKIVSGINISSNQLVGKLNLDGTVDVKSNHSISVNQLTETLNEPFFGRLDFEEDHSRDTIYIGKRGIKDQYEDIIVVDWRRPIASAYYNFTPGYTTQKYRVKTSSGELTCTIEVLKKRQFKIDLGKILSIQQEGPSQISDLNRIITEEGSQKNSEDKLLHSELEKSSSTGYLKEIIATIQAEQNIAIRKPLDKNLLIQGVAGSGKSSIALHRMSYLLYNHEIKPNNMLIIAPSELFISSIEGLLPNLELKGIQQATFDGLAHKYLASIGINLEKQSLSEFYERSLYSNREDLSYQLAKLKTSVTMIAWINEFVERIKNRVSESFKPFIWNSYLVSLEEMKTVYKGYEYLPFDRQMKSFEETMVKKFTEFYENEMNEIDEFSRRIRENFLTRHNLSLEQTAQFIDLLDALTQSKIAILKNSFKEDLGEWKNSIASRGIIDLYKEMWDQIKEIYKNDDQIFPIIGAQEKDYDYFDTAPILYMAIKLGNSFRNYTHIVVDEAQDMSYVQLECLKELTRTMTIIGDTNQSLLMDCGQPTWHQLTNSVFDSENIEFLEMNVSYRSTAEIIDVAKNILAKEFPKQSETIHSVSRSGDPVIWSNVESGMELIDDMIATITEWNNKYRRICIIAKDFERAKKMVPILETSFPNILLMSKNDSLGGEGIFVMAAHEVKGMEFDAVYISNVNEKNFPMSPFNAKLLYTLVTRAQQALAISYNKTPSPLIEDFTDYNKVQLELFEDIL